jgi:hypothetical protein
VDDEGFGPSESLCEGEAPNHLMLRGLNSFVVSDEEKAHMMRQVGIGKANASESLLKCRKF